MRWPGVTLNLYQRALPGASIRSRAKGMASRSVNALGQESLSVELTRHDESGLAVGEATLIATKAFCLMPDTATPK
jgi:hypothetical protein